MFDDEILEPAVRSEYLRWCEIIGEEKYKTKVTLGVYDVLKAHFLVANFFYLEGEGLGGIGPMREDVLHSTLYRQHISSGATAKWTNEFDICATLVYGIIQNHVFHDANKRTAFLSALLYLKNCNRTPSVSHKEFEDFFVDIASRNLKKYSRYRQLIKDRDPDPEVKMISYYLKTNTRMIDKRFYSITYRELKRILNKFDCDIDNPDRNYIDVYKIIKVKKFFKTVNEKRKVAEIGFPSWGKPVGREAIKTVREKCGLTTDNGIDSQVFFKGLDDVESLIAHYQEPLRRLAFR